MPIRIEYGAPLTLVGEVAQEGGFGRWQERAREQALQEARFMADQQHQQAQFMAGQQQRSVENQMRGRQMAESAMENRAQFALRAGVAGDQARRQWYDSMSREGLGMDRVQLGYAGLDWQQEKQRQQFEQQRAIEEQRIEGKMGLAQRNEVAKIRQKMAALQGGMRLGSRMPLVPAAARQQMQALQGQLDGIFGEASKQAEAGEVNEAAEMERQYKLNHRPMPDGGVEQFNPRTGMWDVKIDKHKQEMEEHKQLGEIRSSLTYEKVDKDPASMKETRTKVFPDEKDVLRVWEENQRIRDMARARREGRSPPDSPTGAQAERIGPPTAENTLPAETAEGVWSDDENAPPQAMRVSRLTAPAEPKAQFGVRRLAKPAAEPIPPEVLKGMQLTNPQLAEVLMAPNPPDFETLSDADKAAVRDLIKKLKGV